MIKKIEKKVYIGMSGGVDSSVSALLLKKNDYDVTGVFIKVWQPEFFECTWRQDRLDAMRVCAKLDIPFITLNLESEYKKEVVDYMIEEYKRGRTPNPDVMCNKYVKFGGFFDWAIEQGADYVATGHYARTSRVESRKSKVESKNLNIMNKHYGVSNNTIMNQLVAGSDKNKDQTYFLWTLTQKQLSKTLFPIGDLDKPKVRKLAEKYVLSTAVKKDSQGLCFIGKIDIKDFLRNYIKEKKGKVLDENGNKIGEHDGAFYLTVGQRHGFNITRNIRGQDAEHMRNSVEKNGGLSLRRSGATGKGESSVFSECNQKQKKDIAPYYIISKDIKNNTITVSHSPKIADDESRIVKLEKINWTLGEVPDLSKKYYARIRYRQPLEECRIVESYKVIKLKVENKIKENIEYELHFENPQKAITSGQSAVIYDGEVCLGGGIIS